jgi:T4-like virus Myoviridae tail sheath stabiliser
MENTSTPYYYDHQIRSLILQFMQVFAWLQVNHGGCNQQLVSVPVHYGLKDRVAAAILAGNTQNSVMRLPSIAVYLSNIELARPHLKGYGIDHITKTFRPGGVFPDDLNAAISESPLPFYLNFSVSILTSNLDDQFQVFEQIALLFRQYQVQLQTTDSNLKSNKLVSVDWDGITNENAYPSGTERRVIMKDLQFKALVYIGGPTAIVDSLIKAVKVRLAILDTFDVAASEAAADIEGYVFDDLTLIDLTDGDDDA